MCIYTAYIQKAKSNISKFYNQLFIFRCVYLNTAYAAHSVYSQLIEYSTGIACTGCMNRPRSVVIRNLTYIIAKQKLIHVHQSYALMQDNRFILQKPDCSGVICVSYRLDETPLLCIEAPCTDFSSPTRQNLFSLITTLQRRCFQCMITSLQSLWLCFSELGMEYTAFYTLPARYTR